MSLNTFSLKLVSILRVTLWKVVIKCKIVMFSLFGLFFSKCSFLRFQNFISPSIKYPINLIFSVVVFICKVHVFTFSLVVGIIETWKPENLASNSKHFRIYGILKKWQISVSRMNFSLRTSVSNNLWFWKLTGIIALEPTGCEL